MFNLNTNWHKTETGLNATTGIVYDRDGVELNKIQFFSWARDTPWLSRNVVKSMDAHRLYSRIHIIYTIKLYKIKEISLYIFWSIKIWYIHILKNLILNSCGGTS